MVGLIPQDHILHILGASGQNSIVYNEVLRASCAEAGIVLVETIKTSDYLDLIRQHRPEILLIEEDAFNPNEDYRSRSCRPFKLVITKPDASRERKLELIEQGADEIISRDCNEEELFLKFYSILRRKKVEELSQLTNLPSINKTYKVIEHCRKHLGDWVIVHIDIKHFQSYNLMYGVGKSDEAIRATAKVLEDSILNKLKSSFFLGHLGRDSFLVISDSGSLETIVRETQVQFKKVLGDLYVQSDYDNGFIISSAPNKVRRREGLLRLNIGYCSKIDRNFLSGTDIIEQAIKNKRNPDAKNKKVLILEDDEDFADLLQETLTLEGNNAILSKGIEHIIEEVEEHEPKILILEANKIGHQNFVPLCQELDRFKEELGMKILVATQIPGYQNFLTTGADVYLPKPYEIDTLLKEVRRLRFDHA
ncbi:MAG: diguanylate cyclase [Candidatus Melainabacteria bacterium]|nr:diguanylate cyclase [Candidatus Melainabacteria bacterium]